MDVAEIAAAVREQGGRAGGASSSTARVPTTAAAASLQGAGDGGPSAWQSAPGPNAVGRGNPRGGRAQTEDSDLDSDAAGSGGSSEAPGAPVRRGDGSDQAASDGGSRHTEDSCAPLGDAGPKPRGLMSVANDHLSKVIARRPLCCVAVNLGLVLFLSVYGMASLSLYIETDFQAFMTTDVESSLRRGAFIAARDARASVSRRLQASAAGQIYMSKDLLVAYELKEPLTPEGIFAPKILSAILGFEQSLRDLPEWRALCLRAHNQSRGMCDSGMSFGAYVLPRLLVREDSVVPLQLKLDGRGWDPVPMQVALLLSAHQQTEDLLLPSGFEFDPASLEMPAAPRMLRSAFRFRLPCCLTSDSKSECRRATDAFREEWSSFFLKTLLPKLTSKPLDAEEFKIDVWFDGSDVPELEVRYALQKDYLLAGISLLFVHVYLWLHSGSILLAVLGPIIGILSVPLSFVINAWCFDSTTLSFANFLSLFLVVGFGADVIFVYTDYWRASVDYVDAETSKDVMAERVAWTYAHSLKTSLTTTGTTALSFFANLVSIIRALRGFGFFMGLCVLMAWLLISVIYVPLLVLDDRYCCRMTCELSRPSKRKPRVKPKRCKDRCFEAWARLLQRGRKVICAVSLGLLVLCVGLTIPNFKMMEEAPSMFPDGHNQNRGKQVMDEFIQLSDSFGSGFAEPRRNEVICSEQDFSSTGSRCALHWCEVDRYHPPLAGNGTCSCFRRPRAASCSKKQVRQRFVGAPASLTDSQAQLAVKRGTQEIVDAWGWESTDVPPVLMQDWETGSVSLQQIRQLEADVNSEALPACGLDVLCFCGTGICKMNASAGWVAAEPQRLQDDGARRLADGARQLAAATARYPQSLRTKIRVVFGLDVVSSVRLVGDQDPLQSWSYTPNFDPRQPWAQRNIRSLCSDVPERLRVRASWCWMVQFRTFVRAEGHRFPCRASEFPQLMRRYTEEAKTSTSGTRYIWLVGGELKALYLSFEADVHKSAPVAEALEFKALWDEYLDEWNGNAVRSSAGAFHVSATWVQAEAQRALLNSTVSTLVVLAFLAFLAMLLFTRSCILSTYVVLATMSEVVGLAFFIIVVAQWEIGLLEVIAIIYFIGYALNYSLHIAHKYASDEALTEEPLQEVAAGKRAAVRLQRTSFSLKSIGGAVLGSAATTAGVSFFLLFCKLTIFKKLGGMCLIVTLLSVHTALVPLPAALLLMGPVQPSKFSRAKLPGAIGSLSTLGLTPPWRAGAASPDREVQARE